MIHIVIIIYDALSPLEHKIQYKYGVNYNSH